MRSRLAYVAVALVVVGVIVLGIGANPRYLEELRIGGGFNEPVDGGADLEKNGDIHTNGAVTALSFNGVDPSHLAQTSIDDSDEGQEFPGTDHTADQATSIEEELDALRHMLSDIGGETHWYSSIPVSLKTAQDSISNTSTGHNHDGTNSRAITLIPGNLTIKGNTDLGDADTDKIKFYGVVDGQTAYVASRLFRYANPQNLIAGGNFEAWPNGNSSAPAFWSVSGGGTPAKETSIVKFSSASAKLTGLTSGLTSYTSTSKPAVSEMRGRTFTFGVWIYTSDPAKTQVCMQIDSSTYRSKNATETSVWHLITLTTAIPENSAVFNCYVQLQANDPPVVAYFDGAALVEGPEDWSFGEKPITDRGNQTIYGATTTLEEDVDGAGHDLVVRGDITAGTSAITITNATGYVTAGGIADVRRTINLPLAGWHNPDDSVAIGLVSGDTDGDDPVYFGSYLCFSDEDTSNDWASTTVVVPDNYVDGTGEEGTLVVYAMPQLSVSNLQLQCEVLVQTADSGLSATTYTPSAVTFSSVDVIKECEFDIDAVAPVSPGKVLILRIRRGESGSCTGTILVIGTAFQYMATQ